MTIIYVISFDFIGADIEFDCAVPAFVTVFTADAVIVPEPVIVNTPLFVIVLLIFTV